MDASLAALRKLVQHARRRPASVSTSCASAARRCSSRCRCACASAKRRSRVLPSTATCSPAWTSRPACRATIRTVHWRCTPWAMWAARRTRPAATSMASDYSGTTHIGKIGMEKTYEAQSARRCRLPPGGNQCPGPRAARAGAHAAGAWRESLPDPGLATCRRPPKHAFGDLRRFRGGDRPRQRRRAGLRQPADLRSQPVRQRHRGDGTYRALQEDAEPAAVQPRPARPVPARLHHQALRRPRRAWRRASPAWQRQHLLPGLLPAARQGPQIS